MGTVQFSSRDAELLYSFPKPATDLATIIRGFTFLHRAAPPTYEELQACLVKGLQVGIVRTEGARFVIDAPWYDRIHRADATASNEIEAMLEFESEFVGLDFVETTDAPFALTEEEYASIRAGLHWP